jgi:hypothetical protein
VIEETQAIKQRNIITASHKGQENIVIVPQQGVQKFIQKPQRAYKIKRVRIQKIDGNHGVESEGGT